MNIDIPLRSISNSLQLDSSFLIFFLNLEDNIYIPILLLQEKYWDLAMRSELLSIQKILVPNLPKEVRFGFHSVKIILLQLGELTLLYFLYKRVHLNAWG